jgi:hypothetical protein
MEHVAEYQWNARVALLAEPIAWEDAGPMWQQAFRDMAFAALQALDVNPLGAGHD